ncbi:MAG: hypothetical protein OEZ38_12295 [Gammaproteobacteria bacterium]|nr:hypothetical protein [Gammaproteobacteria bacterium]
MKKNKLLITSALFSSLLLTGCLESESNDTTVNYSGSTSQATIDNNTSADLAKAAIYGILASEESATVMSALQSSDPCTTGGSVTPGINLDSSIDFTFSNCNLGTGKILNGVVGVTGDIASGSFIAQLTDFTLTDSNTGDIDTLENISLSSVSGSYNMAADFTGADGKIYRLDNFILSKTSGSFIITGSIYHPAHGYAVIATTTSITFGTCPNGDIPDGGVITLTGAASSSAIVTYTCSSISLDTGLTTTTANW